MDDLSYTYAQGQLTQVTESGNPDYGYLNAGTGFGYEYGKLVSAGGRGIQLIEYNELNLPKKILTDEGTIEIVYDAEGVKWYQKTTWAVDPPAQYPGGEEEKIYFRGLEIINNQPTGLYHAQGRALLAPDGSLLRQEYSLRDHLGNTRMVFSDIDANGALDFSPNSPEIVQTNTYYPFGMLIEGMQPIDQADPMQAYRYNGKELTLMGGLYDYGARWYMADLGRWGAVDPLAEKMPMWSPHGYALNNPIRLVDPDGRAPMQPNDWVRTSSGAIIYDEKVTDKASAQATYGTNSTYIGKSAVIQDGSGNQISLNENGLITEASFLPTVELTAKRLDSGGGLGILDDISTGLGGGAQLNDAFMEGAIQLSGGEKGGFTSSKLGKMSSSLGKATGIISTADSAVDVWNNPSAGNISKFIFDLGTTTAKMNPFSGMLVAAFEFTGLKDKSAILIDRFVEQVSYNNWLKSQEIKLESQ